MAIIKYRAKFGKIVAVEVSRETEHCVYLSGSNSRANKISDFECYFDTWEEAHRHLLDKAHRHLISARLQLEQAQGEYGNIKGMKKPTEGQ